MLRPKLKNVRSKVRQYILDCVCYDNYEPDTTKSELWEYKVLWVYEIFRREKGYEIKRVGEWNAFSDWLSGLASALSMPFLYSESARDLLKSWLLWTDWQASRRSEEECVDMVLQMVISEFFEMLYKAKNGEHSYDFS